MSLLRLAACLVLASSAASQCMTYSNFSQTGRLPVGLSPKGTGEEVSGVAASRCNPGILWVHDDKGNGAYLLAIKQNGQLAQQYLVQGVVNRDWEDIAIGPGPVPGKSYLYIGELGNNEKKYGTSSIIRVPEPDVPATPGPVRILSSEQFWFRYPGGARDAEALLVDPWDGTAYVMTKETGATGFVYRYPKPYDPTKVKTLALEVSFFHPKPDFSAADFAPDGRRIYFRNRSTIYWVRRPWGKRVKDALSLAGCSIWAGNQGNAEALTVSADGLGLVAIPEGKQERIWIARGALPANGPKTVPSWWCFGTGTSGTFGVPGVGGGTPPILGKAPLIWGLHGGRPGATGFLIVSFIAVPDGKFRFAGGWAHVAPDLVFPVRLDSRGAMALPFGVLPDLVPLRGLKLHAQTVLNDSSSAFGVTLSRGLTQQLDR